MKKHVNLWLVMFLAISLVLPVCSMADMKLTLRTEDGFSVTTNTPTIKSYFVDSDNLVIILAEPPILDFGNTYPDIRLESPSAGCQIGNNAYVTASPGTVIQFKINPNGAGDGATFSPVPAIIPTYYGATFTTPVLGGDGKGTFTWDTRNNAEIVPGKYLAVFNATNGTQTSPLVVMIDLAITVSASVGGTGGTVSPLTQTLNSGDNASITITPNLGNHIASITDNGTAVTSFPSSGPYTYTINNVTTNHNVVVTFAVDTFNVSASVTGGNGTATPSSQSVNYNQSASITITPTGSYHIGSITDNGTSITSFPASGAYTYTINNVTTNHNVVVTFASNIINVTASVNGAGGTATPGTQQVTSGQSALITITPTVGYHIGSITDNGAPFTSFPASGSYTYTISNVTVSHNVIVTFTIDTYRVTASASGTGGSVSPPYQDVSYGGTATFTVTINNGFTASVSPGTLSAGTWTITNVTSDRTATITFTQQPTTPSGETLVWGKRYQIFVAAGTEKVYIADVGPNTPSLGVDIIGITSETDATFSWTFPDGRTFPPPGEPSILSEASSVGNTGLKGQATGFYPNIPDQYIPVGKHILRIKARRNSNMVMTVN